MMLHHQTTITLTRRQLRGYGLSSYLVRQLTQPLKPICKQGRTDCFLIRDLMQALRNYSQKPRIYLETRKKIQLVLNELSQLLGNLQTAHFGWADDEESRDLVLGLMRSQQETDQQLAKMKAIVAEIKGRSTRKRRKT